ncbi:MAG: S26 family signal peptidase [Verrucomicrobiota bacterium]|jgi:signal peptidase I
MILRWFISRTVREAAAARKHVFHILCAQRDLLTPQAVENMTRALAAVQDAVRSGAKDEALKKEMERLEQAANKWLRPYSHPAWRENVEVLLVAITVVVAIWTFFLKTFKIPTGSMQPTLFGVTSRNLLNDSSFQKPTGWEQVKEWFEGISYVHVVADTDGELQAVEPPVHFLIFNIKQTIWIGGQSQTIWFPPDYGEQSLQMRAGLRTRVDFGEGQKYQKGQDVVKIQVVAGDHLFVDRLTYNFRKPQRGEIVVFATAGIPEERREPFRVPGDQFYIKRLVGLGGETLSLAPDYEVVGASQFGGGGVPVGHLLVNGQPLSASTPHFENLYSFPGVPPGTKTIPYQENQYQGHALIRELGPGREFQVATNHLFVMGDNTMNSLDSRFWGDFPAASCIGKSFFVYWPITQRFGWGNQ